MATSQYYVDPAIAGNSGTGTIGDPYGDLQYALNTITRNATDGDQVNIRAGTAEVLAASLTLATYGAPARAAPLILRGYTSAANDGGKGDINGNGASVYNNTGNSFVVVSDLIFRNSGVNPVIRLGAYALLHRCEVHTGTGTGIYISGNSRAVECYVHDVANGVYTEGGALVIGCYVKACSASGILLSSEGGLAFNNIVSMSATGARGIYHNQSGAGIVTVIGNVVRNSAAATVAGIDCAGNGTVIANNIIAGWSGAGGKGVGIVGNPSFFGYNAYYNNTSDFAEAPFIDLTANDVALGADPFTDAANGDFSLTDAAKLVLRSTGWPATYLGAHANSDPHITIGAMQYGPTSAPSGGGAVSISPYRGNL